MTRSYSDPSYGGHQTVTIPGTQNWSSIDGTYQSATTLGKMTFLYPAKVIDMNMVIQNGGTNLGADVYFTIGKSLGGTGSVTGIGTADPLQGTGTHADGDVLDGTVTETSFVAGDDLVFQAIGTIGHAMIVSPQVEVVEVFAQGDS